MARRCRAPTAGTRAYSPQPAHYHSRANLCLLCGVLSYDAGRLYLSTRAVGDGGAYFPSKEASPLLQKNTSRWSMALTLAVLLLSFGVVSAPTGSPAHSLPTLADLPGSGSRTFPETSKTVRGIFLDYWNKNGGLGPARLPHLLRATETPLSSTAKPIPSNISSEPSSNTTRRTNLPTTFSSLSSAPSATKKSIPVAPPTRRPAPHRTRPSSVRPASTWAEPSWITGLPTAV